MAEQTPAEMLQSMFDYGAEVKRLEWKPGDTIVIRHEVPMDAHSVDSIRRHIESMFPGCKGLVLCGGLDIGVMREAV